MRTRTLVAKVVGLAGLATVALLTSPRPAAACGGCFAPPDTETAVDSHRMVIALSAGQTTLWDQIRYRGAPADFVWVLPVPTGMASIDVAEAAFFDDLDAQTAPVISSPAPPCAFAGSASCGGGGGGGGPDRPMSSDGVTVYRAETVGPYESVTVGAEDAGALQAWLAAHGYAVPESAVPVIGYYVALGSAFVVLRLAPGTDVQAMVPVRVRYAGYMAKFPLRMVAIGASGALDLALWVIAEQRYELVNYTTTRIDEQALTWNWDTNTADYGAVFDATIDRAGGRAWVVESAAPLATLDLDDDSDDVAEAHVGLPYPYVTRLRTRTLVDYLDEDLRLAPAADASDVDNQLIAGRETGDPGAVCSGAGGGGAGGDGGEPTCAIGAHVPRRLGALAAPCGLGVLALLLLRRRRRR